MRISAARRVLFVVIIGLLRAAPSAATCCEEIWEVVPGSCVYTQGYIEGGTQGSVILVNSGGSNLRPIFDSFGQTYTHSGMITSWPYRVTHDDMSENFATGNSIGGPSAFGLVLWYEIGGGPLGIVIGWLLGGFTPDVHYGSVWVDQVGLYNGQPGLITQDVSHGSSQAFTGSEGGEVALVNPAPGYSTDIAQYVWNMQAAGNPTYRLHSFLDPDGEWNKPVRGSQGTCYDTCYDFCTDYNYNIYPCNYYTCNPHDCVADPQGSMCSGTVARATNTYWFKQHYDQPSIARAAEAVFNFASQKAHDTISQKVSGYGVSDGAVWEAARGVADQIVNCFTYGDVWQNGACTAPNGSTRSSWQWGTSASGWYPFGVDNISPDDLFKGHCGGPEAPGALQANGRYTSGIHYGRVVTDSTTCEYRLTLSCHAGQCY